MKYLEKIQGLLPLGYLYLIILGLLKESILFHYLGINILEYSSITDILISPVSEMTSNPVLIIITIIIIAFFLIFQSVLVKNSHKSWARTILGKNRFSSDATKEEIRKVILPIFILFIPLELLALFVGLGIGEGRILAKKIDNNELRYEQKVNFNSGESARIHMIDLNSSYYFYVTEGSKNIKIAPIGTIQNIELLKTKKNNEK